MEILAFDVPVIVTQEPGRQMIGWM
jgi:hypothetical protein